MIVRRTIRSLAILILIVSMLPLGAAMATPVEQEALERIEPLVLQEIAADGQTDFFVWMAERADLSPAYQMESREERGRFVYETLVQTADRTQAALRQLLDRQGVAYQAFYIANKVLVRGGDEALLFAVAGRSDVERITANHQFQLEEPVEMNPAGPSPEAVEPNVSFINADDVWALGYTGEGTVMAGNDTGLDETHPTILPHYRGCQDPPTCSVIDHNYNWWDATGTYPNDPDDGHGHGTHTTGTMVGDDGGTNQIGVAPGAQTVHCKNMTDGGSGSDATFTECFQWDLAPWDLSGANPDPSLAPDAINNSWGYWGGGQNQFRDEIQALHAAGILVEVSAGNEGSGCGSLRSPGDYWESLTTGSVNHTNAYPGTITGFSSRGPSSLDPSPPYWFPDIMAPGEDIRSSLPGGAYAAWSGTSMAGPHATALVGLCWSAAPSLRGQVETTIHIITSTATPLTGQGGSNCGGDYTTGPNNDWGWGTVDALAMVNACLALAQPDFTLEAVPDSVVLCKPDTGTSTINVDAIGGYDQPVTLSDSGVPAGVSTSFNPNPVSPLPGSSTYTIDVTAAAADGTYELIVTGTSPTLTHQVTVTLSIDSVAPGSPTLVSPPNGAVNVPVADIAFDWDDLTGATSYHLQVDDDPAFGSPEVDETGITESQYTAAGPLNSNTLYYWRVSGVNGCGEGTFSSPFSFRTVDLCILLVDDDDNGPDVRATYEDALTNLGYAYDVWDTNNSDNEPDAGTLANYSIVIWFTGDEYGGYAGPGSAGEAALGTFLDNGGRLIISSQDYYYDRGTTAFMTNYLGMASATSDVGQTTVTGSGTVYGGLGPYSLSYPFSNWSDEIVPDGTAELAFDGDQGDAAIDKDSGIYRTTFWGFPWEALPTAADRETTLQTTIDWFGGCGPAPGSGSLHGYVYDAETGSPPTCTDATVHVDPLGMDVPVDATGYYTVSLAAGAYNVTASATGYGSDGPYPVNIVTDTVTTQDFYLERPVIAITPTDFVSLSVPVGPPMTQTLWIMNNGSLPLDYQIFEVGGGALAGGPETLVIAPTIQGIDPLIEEQIAASADGRADVFIMFDGAVDLSPATSMDWDTRGQWVYDTLRSRAETAQAGVRSWLEARGIAYRSILIDNSIYARLSEAQIGALYARPEVVGFYGNHIYEYTVPSPATEVESYAPTALAWGIDLVGADNVWADYGITGQGMLVASIDSGVEYTHDALYINYKCQGNPGSNVCWEDPDNTCPSGDPCDPLGHGTHTMGTMIGDQDPSLTWNAGMAPDAQWITCNAGSPSTYALGVCGDWVLAPDGDPANRPHVVNNSWGGSGCDTWYQARVQAWRAAGIFPAFSAGNSGSSCNTVGSPGDYPESFASGATNSSDTIASFSSRGPSCFGEVKPEVSAPGVSVCSSVPGNGWSCGYSGTSMASPHTAGLVALLWDANPALIGDIEATEYLITSTAVPIADGQCGDAGPPNNVYGWGRINAYDAVSAALVNADLPWVWEDPISGTVPAMDVLPVDVTFWCTQTGDLSGTLQIEHNDPCQGTIDVPLLIHCTTDCIYGVELNPPSDAQGDIPGATVTYTLSITNAGTCDDTFDIAVSGNGWPTNAPATIGPLAPGAGTTFAVTVDIPAGASPGDYDVADVTATSQGDGTASASSVLTTTALCLPVSGADFAYSPANPGVGQTVTFTGTVAAGTPPVTYTWAFGDGATGSGQVASHAYTAVGTYTVIMTASNDCGQDSASYDVVVSGEPDITVDPLLLTATLNPGDTAARVLTIGNVGTDDLTWSLAENPPVTWLDETPISGTIAPAGSTPVDVTFDATGLADGVYTTTLEVTSDDPDEPQIDVEVVLTVISSCIPVSGADFAYNPANPGVDQTVTFTGTVAAGTPPVSYAWAFGDGATGSGQVVEHAYTTAGTYTVVMTATNDCGQDTASYDVVVSSGAPDITVDPLLLTAILNPGDTTGRILTIGNVGNADLTWSLAENPLVTWLDETPTSGLIAPSDSTPVDVTFDATGLADGVYTTILEVTSDDPDEPQVDVNVVLTVTSACIPADGADFSYHPANPGVDETVAFTGTVAAGTPPITYAWSFGDGDTGSGQVTSHAYTAVGLYTVVLTASNDCGADTVSYDVTVTGATIQIYLPLVYKTH